VGVVVPAEGSPSALGVTLDMLRLANEIADAGPPFEVQVLNVREGPVALGNGLSVQAQRLDTAPDAVIVVGVGSTSRHEMTERLAQREILDTAQWLSALPDRTQVLGACTATFVMGASGLLDDRTCTTTWWMADVFRERFPRARLDPDLVTSVDGRCWTAGASFSLVPLLMRFVEHTAGADLSDALARRSAHHSHHATGNQAVHRFPSPVEHDDPTMQRLETVVTARLHHRITIDELAAALHTTPRTLHRITHAHTGMSPGQVVRRHRVNEAVRLLRTTNLTVDAIARRVGFADQATLYRAVKHTTGNAPATFRRTST
jgi:transcriptional regulator GlxA family with amidase domain